MTFRGKFFVVFLALSSTASIAQESLTLADGVVWLPIAGQATLPETVRIDELEPPSEVAEFDILYRSIRYELSRDVVRRSSLRIYRFNSEEAMRNYGTLRTGFDAASDVIEIARAMIVDSSGTVHVLDPATVQVVPDNSFNVFSDYRYVVLPMTGIDVGSVAIVADVITSDRSKDVAPWGTIQDEMLAVPQGRVDITIEWDSPDLKPNWNSQIDGMGCSESDTGKLSCSIVDVPSYEIESDVYYDDVTPQFVAAEKMGWQELANWYRAVFDTAISGHTSVQAKATELASAAEDETEVLKAMHDFVSKQIRYVGLEHGDWAYRPHSTETTLARRYGDCKDKAALLIDLLRHRGINMSPVLVATTRKDPGKLSVTTSSYFDHLIVCGELSNGREYCLDATDPYTGIDHLSQWIQGAAALHIEDASAPVSLPADDFQMALREDLKLVLSEDGDLEETGTIEYQGAYGSNIRSYLTGMTPDERDDWALSDYHNTVSTLVEPDFHISGIDQTDTDLTVEWTTIYESLTDSTQSLDYSEPASWLSQSIRYRLTDNKHYDYRFSGILFDSVIKLTIADTWQIEQVSANIEMQSRFGTFERIVEQTDNEVIFKTRFEAPKSLVPVSEIDDFSKFMDIILRESAWRVTGTLRR